MGQYHIVVNLDKKEFLLPHDLGDGLKLIEQVMSKPGGTTSALWMLLAVSNGRGGGDFDLPSFKKNEKTGNFEAVREYPPIEFIGRWGGDRIAIIGDYAEAQDLPGYAGACHIYGQTHFAEDEGEPFTCDGCGQEITDDGGWKNVSRIVGQALEHEFGFSYVGDGWRSRHSDQDWLDTCFPGQHEKLKEGS